MSGARGPGGRLRITSRRWTAVHRFTRPRGLALVALAGVSAALTVASITSAAPQSSATRATKPASKPKIICRARMIAVLEPGTSSENYGTVSCTGTAFGEGVQHDTAQLTRTSDAGASLAGHLKIFFNTGTLRGTYKAGVTVTDETATYTGTIKISS